MNVKDFTRYAAIGAVAAALAACSTNYDVAATRALPTKGGAFNEALKQKYADFVSWEQQEGDYNDSLPYLKKSAAAANGEAVAMDAPVNAEAAAMHGKVEAFVTANKVTNPVRAATAQMAYDCVNHELGEGSIHPEDSDMHDCKKILADAMGPAPAMAAAPAKKIITTALPAPYIVYFAFNKSNLNADSEETLSAAAKAIAKFHVTSVSVEGNTDTVGSDAYNQTLSQTRADTVEAALASLGVPESEQHLKAFGKTHLKVATPDQTKEPRNRRVEIHLEQ